MYNNAKFAGYKVGDEVGYVDGFDDWCIEGRMVGDKVDPCVGDNDNFAEGNMVGFSDDGITLGFRDDRLLVLSVVEYADGKLVGNTDGKLVGS